MCTSPTFFKTILSLLITFSLLIAENKLIPSDWDMESSYGRSVAIDGNTAVVGAPLDDNENGMDAGAVYVFTYDGLNWTQQAKLTSANGASGDQFGVSVAIYEDDIVVGAPLHGSAGMAYVFHRNNGTWNETAQLMVNGLGAQSNFGIAVDIYADLIIIGADQYNLISGTAFIFQYNGNTWQQTAQLTPTDPEIGARFGHDVAIHGDAALVGAYLKSFGMVAYPGAAYVFRLSNGSWTQEQILRSWLEEGEQTSVNAYFGFSVDLCQNYAIVGTYGEDLNGMYTDTGAAYIFFFNGSEWINDKKLKPNQPVNGDEFGRAVAIHNTFAIVGTPYHDEAGNNAGAVYSYQYENGDWLQKDKQLPPDIDSLGYFGTSVAITTEFALIGSGYDYYLNSSDYQAAYLYRNDELNLQEVPSALNPKLNSSPNSFELHQNFPNPFNPSTTIKYRLPETDFIELTVYNVSGRKIKTLVSQVQEAGEHSVDFYANGLANGVYLYHLNTSKGLSQVRKMILLK